MEKNFMHGIDFRGVLLVEFNNIIVQGRNVVNNISILSLYKIIDTKVNINSLNAKVAII